MFKQMAYFILFFSSLCAVNALAKSCPAQCIVGGPPECTIAAQLVQLKAQKPLPTSLAKSQDTNQCPVDKPLQEFAEFISENLLSPIRQLSSPLISAECVRDSVQMVADVRGIKRAICESESSRPTPSAKEPCIPEDYPDHVAGVINDALKCISSVAERPISPQVIFAKMHNESRFSTHLFSVGGKGIGQLTSIGVEQVYDDMKDTALMKSVLRNTECARFHKVLQTPVQYDKNGDVRVCQLTEPNSGLARNAIASMLLFVNSRDQYGTDSVSTLADNRDITDPLKIDFLTLITYGREGRPSMRAAISGLKRKFTAQQINDMPITKFLAELANYSEYIKETINKSKEFAQKRGQPDTNYFGVINKCATDI